MHKNFLSFCLISLLFSGCSFPGVYKIDINQGNIITQEMIDQLKPGMTQRQVKFIMGSPMIVDSFHPERWDYVYDVQPSNQAPMHKHITLFFKDGHLVSFAGDFHPAP